MSESEHDDLVLERMLLGCVIRSRDVLDQLPPLSPEDFLDATHARIWKTILDEAASGRLRSWDAVILAPLCGEPVATLMGLQMSAPRGRTQAVEYAKSIRQSAFDRRIRLSIDAILRSTASGPALRAQVERALSAALDTDLAGEGPRPISESLAGWHARKAKMIAEGRGAYVTTGFSDLDDRTGGLRPGELMIVAGRPATGKTQLSLTMAEANAAAGRPIHYVSLEMMDEQMINRMVSRRGVHASSLRNLHLEHDPESVLLNASEKAIEVARLPIYVDYSSDDLGSIAAHARRMKRQHNTQLLIVDYLQLVGDEAPGRGNRAEEVARISRGLKRLAMQLQIPIVALAQLNREMERDGNRRPILSDLRECITGDTRVWMADQQQVPIAELVGQQPVVMSLDDSGHLRPAQASEVWCSGTQPVFQVRLDNGATLTATARHRVKSPEGWIPLHELTAGARVGTGQGMHMEFSRVVAITPMGDAPVYDMTVPGPANYVSNGILSHNCGSIEQDADFVLFLWRHKLSFPEPGKTSTSATNVVECITAKAREAQPGRDYLRAEFQYARFKAMSAAERMDYLACIEMPAEESKTGGRFV